MRDFDAIIFDMDGTLVDSEVVWEKAETELFADRGIVYNDDARQKVIGLRLDEFFQVLIDHYGMSESIEALSDELNERMLKLIPIIVEAKPGAEEIIDFAVNSGRPYCIASSSPMVIIKAVVKAMNWGERIPHLFTADDVERGKPAPDVYIYAAEQLGADPKRCVAIEDSPNGAKAAVAAGMTCYVVPDAHSHHSRFSSITPHVYDSLHQVLAALRA